MPIRFPNIDRVSELLRVVIAEEVLPAFGNLTPSDIEHKAPNDPGDVVTRVDRLVEARLDAELRRLLPGSAVVGEEATHGEGPGLLALLDADEPVWVIDPIDGTRYFARGEPEFGVMVALVAARRTRAAWIALPVRDELFVAEKGSGTWLNGQRLQVPVARAAIRPRGTIRSKFMPDALRTSLSELAHTELEPVDGPACAAVEYTNVLQGRADFVVYYRLLPWDHLPGALLLEEAGGYVRLASGAPYLPIDRTGPLVLATDSTVGERVRRLVARGSRVE